ncbi:unnamed protein product [Linum tenue]|uniref:Intracellular protein transporter USO1-like protein n=1 Tax=Linum tenue TaxID=586396 RepID=A0AAV0MEC7_9ROSI|nr:unnamed protein product [Linum tenue]
MMKREEEGGEVGKSRDGAGPSAEKKETLALKLKKLQSVGHPPDSTPVRLWLRVREVEHQKNQHDPVPSSSSSSPRDFTAGYSRSRNSPTVSARKLAAAVWEFHHYRPLSKMHRGANFTGNSGGGGGGHRQQSRHRGFKGKGIDVSRFLPDPSPSSPDQDVVILVQPESAGSLRRHIAASLVQHHRSIERSNHALQPVSPASYGSSLEMAPYNPGMTPTSSVEFKGRVGESRYNIKTSTELLKVLNRIWSLEEQHASNMSLVKALKKELDHSRIRIKELLRDQHSDRREMDELMKQINEDKKSKEQDRLHAAVQSLRDEVEDERKLRRRSEGLHRKLSRELSEVKSSFSNALKEMEKERKSRMLLEDLCDEFARGIKEYDQELHHAMKQKPDHNDWVGRSNDGDDRLILHISESWLDERIMQMRLDEEARQHGYSTNSSIVDKLGFEIETFLKARRMAISKNMDKLIPKERRNSMESVPFKAVSAPPDVGDEDDDSVGSDSQCFELNKPSKNDYNVHEHEDKKKLISSSRERVKSRSPSSLQVKFEEQMVRAMMSSNADKNPEMVDLVELKPSGNYETTEGGGGTNERRNKATDEIHESNSNYAMDNLIKSHISAASEAGNLHLDRINAGEASSSYPSRRTAASPVRQWMAKLTTTDPDVAESSTKLPPASKDSTLKAKLLEARSRGPRSRLKLFRGPS